MYFRNIDLLRGFAAISVVVYHVIELTEWTDFPREGLLRWFRIGWMGVDLFFVISGFVVALTAIRLLELDEHRFPQTFVVHRFARIAPLYFLTGGIFLLFVKPELLGYPSLNWHLLSHALFIHHMDWNTRGSINGPNWSVGIEMQFYLLILITASWIRTVSPWKLLGICLLISWVWRGVAFFIAHSNDLSVFHHFAISVQLPGVLDEFAYGVLLCKIVLARRDLPDSEFNFKGVRLDNPWLWLVAAILATWCALSIYWRWASFWEFPWMVVFWRSLAGLAIFFIVGTVLWARFPSQVSSYVLRPFNYLGEISYGIYLWHLPVILSLQRAKIGDSMVFLTWTLALTFMLSALSWHLLERPLIRRAHQPMRPWKLAFLKQ